MPARAFQLLRRNIQIVNAASAGTLVSDLDPPFAGSFNPLRTLVDFTGANEFRVITHWKILNAPPPASSHRFQIRREDDPVDVLYDGFAHNDEGEKEEDSGWRFIPAWATLEREVWLELVTFSGNAGGDHLYRDCVVLVR